MEWRQLSSSVIARVAYDETSHTLIIEFRSGTTYEYFDVPEKIYQELVDAASAGTYFAENIRDVYRYART
ncbi:MAG TPA: KTSC domain-containing protein [Thermoanaerobaculia bacterium]|nr:KTSC domain-containing protein [Thermoanaerobaculia bacterium]